MATKAIKLSNGTDDLLPITNAKVVQMTVDGTSKSVHDVIIENEEVTAAALNALNATKSDIGHTHDLSDLDISSLGLSYTAGSGFAIDDSSSAGAININGGTDIYVANSGNTLTVNHKQQIGTGATVGPAANSSKTLNPGDTFAVPRLTFSTTGHVNSQPTNITYTFPTIVEYTNTSSSGASNSSSGTSPYLNLAVNGTVKSSQRFVGSGGITVSKTAATTVSVNGTTYTLSTSVSGGVETLTLTRGGASTGTTTIPLNLRYDIVNNNMDAITII